MQPLQIINLVFTIIFFVCYAYQLFYIPVSWFMAKKKKAPPAPQDKKYAVLVCARNEEKVIGDLIDSLHTQTYDVSKLTIIVMADNCSDHTADIAKDMGAIVYTRSNQKEIGKGYAMTELMKHIKEDFPKGFDGYFVFDADNVLKSDYIEQMNNAFALGYDVVTSYRNSKNYGDNMISAGSGLWFLRESRYLNHPRYLLNISCAVSGTGYLMSQKKVDEIGGWPYHLLIEDVEFSVNCMTKGEKIGYCADAEYFDEQPTKFGQSFRQRLRWARGYLQILRHYGGKLIKGAFKGNFACADTFLNCSPIMILSILSFLINIIIPIIVAVQGDNVWIALESFALLLVNMLSSIFLIGLITTISEWKKIRTTVFKKIWYTITFPFFIATYFPIVIVALFHKPQWKQIEHNVTVDDLRKKEKKNELHDITHNK